MNTLSVGNAFLTELKFLTMTSTETHNCPYDKENCEIGAMCVECCADNNVYCRY